MRQRGSVCDRVAVVASAAAASVLRSRRRRRAWSGCGPGRREARTRSRAAIDAEYTRRILEDTTEKFFLSPLVDYLPASKTVPTPKAVLG